MFWPFIVDCLYACSGCHGDATSTPCWTIARERGAVNGFMLLRAQVKNVVVTMNTLIGGQASAENKIAWYAAALCTQPAASLVPTNESCGILGEKLTMPHFPWHAVPMAHSL